MSERFTSFDEKLAEVKKGIANHLADLFKDPTITEFEFNPDAPKREDFEQPWEREFSLLLTMYPELKGQELRTITLKKGRKPDDPFVALFFSFRYSVSRYSSINISYSQDGKSSVKASLAAKPNLSYTKEESEVGNTREVLRLDVMRDALNAFVEARNSYADPWHFNQ